MSEHTHGPWKLMPEDGAYYERIESDQGMVVVFKGGCRVYKREDLLLILAAPDLLEALEELYHLIDDAHDGERIFTLEMQMKAKAAIAKAKGKPNDETCTMIEVKHTRSVWECSVCGEENDDLHKYTSDHICPSCGAKIVGWSYVEEVEND